QTELLPCPCCGGKAEMDGPSWNDGVHCTVCELQTTNAGPSRPDNIAAWNRRAQPQQPSVPLPVNEHPGTGRAPIDADDVILCRRRQQQGNDKWAIYNRGSVLSKDGTWEYEPLPSSRDDEFLARCRFDSPQEALAAYHAVTPQEPTP